VSRRCCGSRRRGWCGTRSRLGFCRFRRFCRGLLFGQLAEMLAHNFGVFEIERARMRFLLGYADLGQILDQELSLDLEFSRQFIDSDLIRVRHA
jgi:hypothetical protein